MTLDELQSLVKDRPQITGELYPPNDFYGHATILKQYAQVSPDYQIKAAIEHGPIIAKDNLWNCDINSSLPALFIAAPYRYSFLKTTTNKALFSIGPIINYASHFLDEESLKHEKQRLRRNLLAFAAHSTHWIDSNYDINSYCQFIKELGRDFDTIRICLYWKDILRGHAEIYLSHGFECVTAGHMYDPLFLPRLKSIIELSTFTISNEIGTQTGYCILMGKQHYLWKTEITVTGPKEDMLKERPDYDNDPNYEEVKNIFAELHKDITPQQRDIVRNCWGTDQIKSPEEMREIFEITEDMYKKGPIFFVSNKKVLIEQALDYLNVHQYEKALILFNQSLKVYPEIPRLLYDKAISLAKLERTDEAISAVNDLLAIEPDNIKARQLLIEINSISPKQKQLDLSKDNNALLKPSDVWIVSYPRSGNTWIRLLISDIILQLHGFDTGTELPIHADDIIPDIQQKNIDDIDTRVKLPFRLIKTHWTREKVRGKVIYIFRKPAEALCSYYYFHLRYPHLKNKVSSGIDIFVTQNIDEWCRHIKSYIKAYESGEDILFISYEYMHEDPVLVLKSVSNFIGISADETQYKKAIKNHTFDKHHNNEQLGDHLFEYFFRKGKVDSAKNELKLDTIKHIEERALHLYDCARQIEKSQLHENMGSTDKLLKSYEHEKYIQEGKDELQKGNIEKAFDLLNKAKSLKLSKQGLDFLRATCFLKMHQVDAAREVLQEELRYFPENIEAENLLNDILKRNPPISHRYISDLEFYELLKIIRPYTMLSEERLYSLFSLAKSICEQNILGNFVECGVAAGGSTALLAYVIKKYSKQPRLLYAFDSFEGMPSPTEHDKHGGQHAESTGWGTGTCAATEDSVCEVCAKLDIFEILEPVKGYFQDTLPVMRNTIGTIAFLHMDSDWYESTKIILNNFYDIIANNGIVQVDDYGHWEGCKKAIQDFEYLRTLKFDMHTIDYSGVWFSKPAQIDKK
ncbi:MAG: TylF/MycF/NovP-related O-methyltransferase [Thermodesulfovibrionales bacterium]